MKLITAQLTLSPAQWTCVMQYLASINRQEESDVYLDPKPGTEPEPEPEPKRRAPVRFKRVSPPSSVHDPEEIAEALKGWRKHMGWTQSLAASHFGVSQYMWHTWEHAHKHHTLGKTARALMNITFDKVYEAWRTNVQH